MKILSRKQILNLLLILALVVSMSFMTGCKDDKLEDDHVYSFMAPSGTPSLAFATLFDNNPRVTYEIVSGSQPLIAAFTSGSHDFIVAPVNVGAKLFANKAQYKLVKTIVWGNFYLASLTEINSLQDLEGKTITAFSQNSSPDIMLKVLLEASGLKDKVTIEYTDSVTSANSLLMSGKAEIIVSAEPSISVLKTKKDIYTIDMQEEWNKVSDGNSFPQAGLFVNTNLLTDELKENTMAFINVVLSKIEDYKNPETLAASAVKIDTAFETIGVDNLEKAIPNCWIALKELEEDKAAIEYYAEKLISLGLGAQIGEAKPSEEFYLE